MGLFDSNCKKGEKFIIAASSIMIDRFIPLVISSIILFVIVFNKLKLTSLIGISLFIIFIAIVFIKFYKIKELIKKLLDYTIINTPIKYQKIINNLILIKNSKILYMNGFLSYKPLYIAIFLSVGMIFLNSLALFFE
jgi:Ca2+/Na+ antiporter